MAAIYVTITYSLQMKTFSQIKPKLMSNCWWIWYIGYDNLFDFNCFEASKPLAMAEELKSHSNLGFLKSVSLFQRGRKSVSARKNIT